jgi:hypothetical protein
VTGAGNVVVIAPSLLESADLTLFDLDNGTLSRVGNSRLHLREFVQREAQGELWMIENDSSIRYGNEAARQLGLFRFDFLRNLLEPIALDWQPRHINRLPRQDLLVLDDVTNRRLVFWDPATRQARTSVPLVAPRRR